MQKLISNQRRRLGALSFALLVAVLRLPFRAADGALGLASMLVVVFKRLRHNLGLAVSTILGVVAVLSIVVGVPIFSNAVSSEVLRQQLEEKAASTHRGLFSIHMYYLDDKANASPITVDKTEIVTQYIQDNLATFIGLKLGQVIPEIQSGSLPWKPVKMQAAVNTDENWMSLGFFAMDNLPENAILVDGEWPSADIPDNEPVQVAILADTADQMFINVGDVFKFSSLEVVIAGLWEPKENVSGIWFSSPNSSYEQKMWIPLESYRRRLSNYFERPVFYASWYILMDEASLQYDHAAQYTRGLVRMDSELSRLLPNISTDYTPLDALKAYQQRAETLTTLFYAVGGPMVILALLFISLTATIAVQQYEQETATLRGRGTSWGQVALLNLTESTLLVIIAIPLSILTGWLAAQVMGRTSSFLQFNNYTEIPFSLQGLNALWLGLGIVLIVAARFLPITSLFRTSIVRIKQEQSREAKKTLWERFFLDFILLIPGIYAYATLSGLAKPASFMQQVQISGGGQYRDPLLFIAPSLFAMAVCMISLRILPFLLRILAKLVDRMPGVWAYLSLQQIARRPQDHFSALLLIMISLSLSVFSASTAKTLDKWLHDSTYYESGADLAVHEYVVEGGSSSSFLASEGPGITMSELDLNVESYLSIDDHLKLPSVEAATRVGKYQGTYSYGVGEETCIFMGIDRLDFHKVAFYRDDFAGESLGALLNALGSEPMGMLIPKDLAEEKGFRIGDRLLSSAIIIDQSLEREFVIVGTYEYFPTIYPADRPTLIVNLDSIFDNPDSVIGYDMWLKLRPDAEVNVVLYQLRQMLGINRAVVEVSGNAFDDVQTMLNQPERVGVFGVLNVGFIATGLMPGIGFVLYSYASLRRRFIQLGILQAIGLSVKQLIGYLALELVLLMGLAISSGAAVGLLSSYLFVPFLQVGASPGKPVPPFEVLIGWTETGLLSLAFGIVLFMTMIGTIIYLARMKVFQAVKMGETL